MMEAGVNHLPVVDADGAVVGILSASSLMTLDALSPFALRHAILTAHTVDEVVAATADVPELFVDLVDAHLDAPALTRVITVLSDAMTSRLLELTIARRGCAAGRLLLARARQHGPQRAHARLRPGQRPRLRGHRRSRRGRVLPRPGARP